MADALSRTLALLLSLAVAAVPHAAYAQPAHVWTEVFGSSPAAYVIGPDLPPEMKSLAVPRAVSGTIRVSFVISGGGDELRIRFSNEVSEEPLPIDGATVAIADPATGEPAGPLLPVHFGGQATIVVPPGAPVLSDAVALRTKAQDRIVVSLFTTGTAKFVTLGGKRMSVSAGDQTRSTQMSSAQPLYGRPLVTGVLVSTARPLPVIATLGDSLTDGNRANPNQPAGYSEILARRLIALPEGQRRAIVNAGIGGNRLLATGSGLSALARLDRDVLRIANLSHIVLLEGINDIGRSGSVAGPLVTSDQLIAAYRQVIARAHLRGVKVIGGTLMPFGGARYDRPDREAVRQSVNSWIRTSGEFDGVIDFEAAVRDPANPLRLRPDLDSGDHLHPNDAGYVAMGEAIDLRLFR